MGILSVKLLTFIISGLIIVSSLRITTAIGHWPVNIRLPWFRITSSTSVLIRIGRSSDPKLDSKSILVVMFVKSNGNAIDIKGSNPNWVKYIWGIWKLS